MNARMLAAATIAALISTPGWAQTDAQTEAAKAPAADLQPEKRVSPAERAQSANVRVEVTVSEQRGTATPARKTVSLVIADHERGYMRSMAMMPATSQKDNPAVTNLSFDVDASAQFLDGMRVRLNITMKIETPDRGDSDALVTPRARVIDSMTVIVESGKPLMVAQSTDPISDRVMTVELKGTILR